MKKKILTAALLASLGSAYAQDSQQVSANKPNYSDRISQAIQVLSGKSTTQTTTNQDNSSQQIQQPNQAQETAKPAEVPTSSNTESEKVEEKSNQENTKVTKEGSKTVENPAPKPVKKKYKPKPVSTTNIDSTKAALVSATYQHIPSHISIEEAGEFLRPMQYSDVSIKTIDTSSSKMTLQLIDNRTNMPLEVNAVTSDKIKGLAVDSDLTNIRYTSAPLSNNETTTVNLNGVGDCQAVYLTYQLKSQPTPTTQTVFLDRLSNAVNDKSSSCEFANINSNETTFYTKSGYIINVGFDKKLAANKQIGMTLHTSKDGRPFSSHDTVVYAISRDFKKAYPLTVQHDSRGSYFGSKIGEQLPSGNYYVVIGFSYESKYEWVSTVTSIN